MDLTPANKAYIDGLSYRDLLHQWRFAPGGDPWFQGETGKYWRKRLIKMMEKAADPVRESKAVGWERP